MERAYRRTAPGGTLQGGPLEGTLRVSMDRLLPTPAAAEGPLPEVLLLEGGRQAYPRMLAAIGSAAKRVHLEVYAFADDETGQAFVEALTAAALRGVQVLVVLDAFGSAAGGRAVLRRLEDGGCEARLYNPLAALLAGRLRRDHRKLLLVDGEVAFLGGINIGNAYGQVGVPDQPHWIDLALELRGPAVAALAARLEGSRRPAQRGEVRVYLSSAGGGRRLRRRYLKALGSARRRVLLAHAYFLPDRHLIRSITAAARRGVDVRLVVPGKTDVPLARAASRSLYGRLLRAGVRIYEWDETVLHAKAAVVDERRLLLGSFNLDPLSLVNLETLAEVRERSAVLAGVAFLERLVAGAHPVAEAGPRARTPLAGRLRDALGLFALRAANWLGRRLAPRRAR